MSQAGYTPIQLYYSTTAAAAPSAGNLANGELAVNITDGKLFYKDNGGVVRVLATAAGSAGDVVGPGSSTDNALVRFDGTTGKLVQNSAGVLDDSGNLTGIAALTTSGALTLNGGTANGVPYLNGSKVLTTGSALTFDGSTVGINTGINTVAQKWQGAGTNFELRVKANDGSASNASAYRLYLDYLNGTAVNGFIDFYRGGAGADGYLAFGASGSEQMRLTSTGLGIGTSSPGYKLTVNGFTAVSGPQAAVKQTAEANAFSGIAVQRSTNDSTLGLAFNSIADAWQISASYASSGAYKPIQLLTGDTVRATLDSSGNLLVGKTSTALSSNGLTVQPNGEVYSCVVNTSNSMHVFSTTVSAYRFYVTGTGTINATNTSITAISDQSLKENVRDLETGLSQVMALRPRRFDWKEDTGIGEKNVAGFIAQELEQVLPELVYEYQYKNDEVKKSIKMGDILPTLVKAIQEQQAIIQSMEARIAALEAK